MEYTFFTKREFRKELRALGARVQYSGPYYDEDTGEFDNPPDNFNKWGMHPRAKVVSEEVSVASNFQIVEEEFSEENQMINSTLKMVRHKITETYRDKLELMYGKESQQRSKASNLDALRSLFDL